MRGSRENKLVKRDYMKLIPKRRYHKRKSHQKLYSGGGVNSLVKILSGRSRGFEPLPLLGYLAKATPEQRQSALNRTSDEDFKKLQALIQRYLRSKERIPSDDLKKLRRYKHVLFDLIKNKNNIKTQRKILNQKGGFIGALLGPLIGSAIGGIVKLLK